MKLRLLNNQFIYCLKELCQYNFSSVYLFILLIRGTLPMKILQINIISCKKLATTTDKLLGECLFLTDSPYTVTIVTGTCICF